jgi:hypothetical protein
MKKLIPVLILISLLLVAGCPSINGRPPEFSVSNPNIVPDGLGGLIVAYQVNEGNTGFTYLQRLGVNGDTLWGEKGVELNSDSWGFLGSSEVECVPLVSGGKGNFVTVYTSKDGLWIQKLDMEGNPIWPASKIRVSDTIPPPGYFRAVSDNSNGAIIVWSAGQNSIELQRIDGEGGLLWNTIISVEVDRFDIAGDASSNTFVMWKDNPAYSEGNIFVQKVDANGRVAWSTGGLELTKEQNPGYVGGSFDHRIICDGDGGALCIWVQANLSKDGREITGFALHVQRINSEGEMLWEPGGVLITEMMRAQEPRIIGSNPDYALVFWEDMHIVYTQKIDILGNSFWPGTGLEIAQASNIVYYSVADDGAGGAVVVWNCSESGHKYLLAQHLDSEGAKLWGDNGIKVSTVSPYWAGYSIPARISSDGTGDFVIAWASGNNIKDKTSSYIQRISTEGKLLWGENGIELSPWAGGEE